MVIKKLIFSTIILLFLNSLVLAQENVTKITREEAERIARDFLLDIPIPSEVATELAKNLTGTEKEPDESSLVLYSKKGEILLAWNFSFKNKEVLIDATSGKLIHVKMKVAPLGFVGSPIFIIFMIIIGSFVIVYLFKVLMDKYFKKKEIPVFYEEESF
ncbi:MAG: hypothetical protein QMD36_00060 [Candidatus Aenigmarchaeota archaeon]|nr:hypothetical protein [Candidatus Aenigmarchaeota archaeon]